MMGHPRQRAQEWAHFIKQGIANPRQISAIAPSSDQLAIEMIKDLDLSRDIVELGPGTGVFTRKMIEAGADPARIHLVDMNENFCASLRKIFTETKIYCCSASDMALQDIPRVKSVVSGLPLLSMPLEIRRSILSSIVDILDKDGIYAQFTYGSQNPFPDMMISEFGLSVSQSKRIWRNLPPAVVYRFRKDYKKS